METTHLHIDYQKHCSSIGCQDQCHSNGAEKVSVCCVCVCVRVCVCVWHSLDTQVKAIDEESREEDSEQLIDEPSECKHPHHALGLEVLLHHHHHNECLCGAPPVVELRVT